MEEKGMHHEDQLSTVQRAAERVREPIYVEVTKIVEVEKIVQVAVNRQPRRRPDPKFTGGQGIFQWWASWMAGAAVAPPTIKKKRPAWFTGSVSVMQQLCPQEYRDAGMPGTSSGAHPSRSKFPVFRHTGRLADRIVPR